MTNKFNPRLNQNELQRLNRFGIGVFTFVFNKNFSKILLIKRNEEKRIKYGFDWGIVGGKLEPGERLMEGALREAKEEVGLDLTKEQLKFIYFEEMILKERAFTGVQFCYAINLDEDTPITINEESEGYRWFSINKLPESMGDSKETIERALALARGAT